MKTLKNMRLAGDVWVDEGLWSWSYTVEGNWCLRSEFNLVLYMGNKDYHVTLGCFECGGFLGYEFDRMREILQGESVYYCKQCDHEITLAVPLGFSLLRLGELDDSAEWRRIEEIFHGWCSVRLNDWEAVLLGRPLLRALYAHVNL